MKNVISYGLIAGLLAMSTPAHADSAADMRGMLETLQKQMSQLQSTIDQQNLRIQQLESRKVLETPQPSVKMEPSQAISQTSDADFQKGIKDNLGEAFPWLKGVKYGGDLRLRYEAFEFLDKNNDAGSTGTTADRTRNRFRIRLRWGMEKEFGDDWKAGLRLATG